MADRMDSLDEIRELAPEVVRQMGDMLGNGAPGPAAGTRTGWSCTATGSTGSAST